MEKEVIYFSNAKPCLEATQHETIGFAEKSSDHEEFDTKLVLHVKAQNVLQGKTVVSRQQTDMSTSLLREKTCKALAAVYSFSGNVYNSSL